jgi:DNA-binding XRE family transcriptional regulator
MVMVMDKEKQKKLEASGWKLGSTAEFLDLNEGESAYIELKLSLSKNLQKKRRSLNITQKDLARLIKSSQSRVAKMEAGDPTVSLDLLVKSLLVLKTTKQQLVRLLPH